MVAWFFVLYEHHKTMLRPVIRPVCVCLVIWLAAAGARSADTMMNLDKEEKEDLALLSQGLGVSFWDESFSVRNGVGYNDNVLLDAENPNRSPFFLNGLDATILRLPIDDWGLSLFVSGDDIRYWRDVGVGSEDNWLTGGKAQWSFAPEWQASFLASYDYGAQVMDLLSGLGLGEQAPTKIIGDTITLKPAVRRDLGTNYWIEMQFEGTRQIYDSPAFSYWRYGPRVVLGRKYGHRSDITVSYGVFNQPYDNESQVEPDGTEIPRTDVRCWLQRFEVAWHYYWDKKLEWENITRLNFDMNGDNGPGYFNYRRYAAAEELDYNRAPWKLSASAGLQYYHFPYQQVSDTDLSNVYQSDLTLNVHVERQVIRCLKLFVDYQYEHTYSDDPTEHYVVNIVKGGVSWEF
jgi:hypothetical protein